MEIDLIEIAKKMPITQWVVVVTLLVMAVASAAVFVERLWSLEKSRRASRRFAPDATQLVLQRDFGRLAGAGETHRSSHLARLLASGARTYLGAREHPSSGLSAPELARRALGRQRESIESEMNRGLGVLASTGSVAPFVGLLGTVLGIVASFEGIAREGGGGLGAVSAGIAEALVVTALGLLVAIPAVLAFNHLSTRVERLLLALDHASGELVDHLEAGEARPNGATDSERPSHRIEVEKRASA
jgi:biopolymer transport protein ExbB